MSDMRKDVLETIKKGKVAMRPRWHFLLLGILAASGVLIVFLTLLYTTSLAVFFMRESGVWYAPAFGGRGWFEVVRSLPLLLILLIAVAAGALEILARRYSFAYRSPLLVSLGGILAIVFLGGFAIAQTSLHHRLASQARRGHLPPMGILYGGIFRMHAPDDMRKGVISERLLSDASGSERFLIVDPEAGTTTVVVTTQTRLPYGEDFLPGDTIVVVGDETGTGTIRAYGVREISEEK